MMRLIIILFFTIFFLSENAFAEEESWPVPSLAAPTTGVPALRKKTDRSSTVSIEIRAGKSAEFSGKSYDRWQNFSTLIPADPLGSYYLHKNNPELKSSMGEMAFEYRQTSWLGTGLSIGNEEYRYQNLSLVPNKLYGIVLFQDIAANGFPDTPEKRAAQGSRLQTINYLRLMTDNGLALSQPLLRLELTLHLPLKRLPLEPRIRFFAGGAPGVFAVGVSPGFRYYLNQQKLYVTGEFNFQVFTPGKSDGFLDIPGKHPIGIINETSMRLGIGYSFERIIK